MHLIICCLKDNHGRKCMYGHYTWKSIDKPGKVANPARGQLNRKNEHFPVLVRAGELGFARQIRRGK